MTMTMEREPASSGAKDPLAGAIKAYRKTMMQRLHDKNVPQAAIADIFGVSRPSVHSMIHSNVTTPNGTPAEALLDGATPASNVDGIDVDGEVARLIGMVMAYHRNVVERSATCGVTESAIADLFGVSDVVAAAAVEFAADVDAYDADVDGDVPENADGTPGRPVNSTAGYANRAVVTPGAPLGMERRKKLSRAQRKAANKRR